MSRKIDPKKVFPLLISLSYIVVFVTIIESDNIPDTLPKVHQTQSLGTGFSNFSNALGNIYDEAEFDFRFILGFTLVLVFSLIVLINFVDINAEINLALKYSLLALYATFILMLIFVFLRLLF